MSEDMLEPIDEDLDALLEKERAARPPAGALERIWARAAAAPFVREARPSRTDGWLASHAVPVAIAAFVLGGAAGAGLSASLRAPLPERVVPVYLTAPSAPVAPPPPTAALAAPGAVTSSTAPRVPVARDGTGGGAPHPGPPPPAASSSSSLSAEQLLLDQARAALSAGQPERTLDLLSEHARRFARPQLGEAREALAIQALAVEGRFDEARARAARFRASAPNSLFLPAVDATLASIP